MNFVNIKSELEGNTYPGRGIILGMTPDGAKAAIAYFIMGRSENSRNRVFVEDGAGIRTQAFDPAKPVSYTHLDVYKRQLLCRIYHSARN